MSSGSNASTQPANNSSAPGGSTQATATTGSARRSSSPAGSPAPPDAPQAQVTIQCDAIVETYRTGVNPSKPDVLAQVIRVLTDFFNARPGHDADFNNALRVYIEMLDTYESEQRVLHQEGENQMRARAGNETEEGRPGRPRAADFHDEEDEGENGGGGESELEEGSDHDVDEDDGPGPAKRPRIDESQFPWQPVREISRALLHPELQLTLELVENYTLDLKAARRSLTNSPECPEFPEEQWLALLAGKAVNLDSVYTADHSTSINEVQTHEISEGIALRLSENMSNPSESKRVIKNADEWTTTWHTYTQAVLVAFPHRYRELALYQQYMSSLFRTTAIPLHCRVFVLDRAIRNRVGRCRNILLSETDKFRDLERSHISPVGMAYQEFEEGRSESRLKRKNGDRARSLDACRRWNGGVCPSSDGKCRYKHVCSSCKGGHPVSSCPGRA